MVLCSLLSAERVSSYYRYTVYICENNATNDVTQDVFSLDHNQYQYHNQYINIYTINATR
uniref:Uncharacterized protein n=1 Tax=Myoviridae sp. ct5xZ3 TaxID=2827601 RepID=A0A8S5RRL1_9CAUD|nr:MAG TPA: hypothetical protein [Myoviridae sp. ct5xZ3]